MVLNPVALLMADVAFRLAVALLPTDDPLLLIGDAYLLAIDTGLLADVG